MTGALGAGIALDLVAMVFGYSEVALLSRMALGETVTEAETTTNDDRQGLMSILQLLSYVATAVFFLIWIHRAYRNLPSLGVRRRQYSTGWAVGGFFVPFLNLVRPYEIVKEIWKGSNPDSAVPDDPSAQVPFTTGQYASKSPLIGVWWGLWILSNMVSNAIFRFSSKANTAEELLTWSWVSLGSNLLWVAAGVLAILVVKGIDAMQEEKHRRLTLLGAPQSAQAIGNVAPA
ncbi:MAG: DUF4328 domain-containing protein [Acidobacteriota bacterium]